MKDMGVYLVWSEVASVAGHGLDATGECSFTGTVAY